MVSHQLQPEAFGLRPPRAPTNERAESQNQRAVSEGLEPNPAGSTEQLQWNDPCAGDRTPGRQRSAGQPEHPDDVDDLEGLDFEGMYRRFSPYVAKIGYRLLGRDHEVDDLVQDVFLAAHRGLRTLRNPAAIRGWLATVTVRLARRRLRSRRVRATLHLDSSPDYSDIVGPQVNPEERAQVAHIYRLLDRMPVNHRIAWSLRYVEGETLDRVAELCECSLATAKRRIKAAQDTIKMEVSRA